MKTAALVGIIVAGALGAFAIYTWGWRDSAVDDERAHAEVIARELASSLDIEVGKVKRVAPGLWEIQNNAGCAIIHLDEYKPPTKYDREYRGVSAVACS